MFILKITQFNEERFIGDGQPWFHSNQSERSS